MSENARSLGLHVVTVTASSMITSGRFTSSLCWLYHTFNPADNGIHPARPQGSNSLCSWIGCTARSVLVHVVGFVQELEHIGERGQVAIVPVSALGPSFV